MSCESATTPYVTHCPFRVILSRSEHNACHTILLLVYVQLTRGAPLRPFTSELRSTSLRFRFFFSLFMRSAVLLENSMTHDSDARRPWHASTHTPGPAHIRTVPYFTTKTARVYGIHGFLIGRVPRRLPVEKGRGGGRSITGLRRALTATRTPEQKSKFKKTYIASLIRPRVPRKQLCATALVASCHFFYIYVCVAPSLPLAGKYKK